jgi:uncharacterized protein (DUF983 family)
MAALPIAVACGASACSASAVRDDAAAALTVVLVGWIVAQPASFGSAVIENTGAPPILDRPEF